MRKLDSVGRITLPVDIRKQYNIDENTDLQIIDNGNGILIIPANKPYIISENNMETLRKIYVMLKESGLIDSEYEEKLAKITKETDSKCATCGNKMFLAADNTYRCYKCE